MLDSLTSAVSGLDAFQQQMTIIGNNIANIDTTGFKAARPDFGEAFSNTLQAATAATSTTDGTNPIQLGTGVGMNAITNNWAQGALNPTNVTSDLAINGNGFFVVKDPATSTQYVTQDGTFSLDPNGYLVNGSGQRVQGYPAGSTTLGDIIIAAPASSTAVMVSYTVSPQGTITVALSDGTTAASGQILLQNFEDPQALESAGNNLYTNTAAAGPLAAPVAPGSSGLGTILSGELELSNVDLSAEMANLIAAQRGFEANSKMITTSDEVLQDVVNMKR